MVKLNIKGYYSVNPRRKGISKRDKMGNYIVSNATGLEVSSTRYQKEGLHVFVQAFIYGGKLKTFTIWVERKFSNQQYVGRVRKEIESDQH